MLKLFQTSSNCSTSITGNRRRVISPGGVAVLFHPYVRSRSPWLTDQCFSV